MTKRKATKKSTKPTHYTVSYDATEQTVLMAHVADETVAIMIPEITSYFIIGPDIKAMGPLKDEIEDAPMYHDRVMACYNHWLADEQNGGLSN